MTEWQVISGGVTAPRGFRAAGVTAGLKPSGLPDLALIVSDVDAIAAGVFTTSHVCAACIDYCKEVLRSHQSVRAILCNAGQANAATGKTGMDNARESAQLLANELKISPNQVLLASTGVIGQQIKMAAMRTGIPQVVAALSPTGAESAERAIITTDLVTKSIALETIIGDRTVRIGGMAKGSGMIHPNMATMLAFVTCDAAVSPHLWQQMVTEAADKSFNAITVDGDTSTNDCLIALANGESRAHAITEKGTEADRLAGMLTAVCQHLAKAIARDGEGATCLIEVRVNGAPNEQGARQVAKAIAGSSLVKSAIFGRDPNWGRIAAAAGRAGVPFDQNKLRIQLGDFLLMEHGQPLSFDRSAASEYLKNAADAYPGGMTATSGSKDLADKPTKIHQSLDKPVVITVDLGAGHDCGLAWGCDLSYDYVKINAEYTT